MRDLFSRWMYVHTFVCIYLALFPGACICHASVEEGGGGVGFQPAAQLYMQQNGLRF